jgi:hypothetical protein
MGLCVSVYKFPLGDCTNKGISGRMVKDLCLVNVEGPTKPHWDVPAAMLVKGNVPGHVKIVPAEFLEIGEWRPKPGWWMMGGNFAHTSDSRFHDAVREIIGTESYGAVPIHDRQE